MKQERLEVPNPFLKLAYCNKPVEGSIPDEEVDRWAHIHREQYLEQQDLLSEANQQ